MPRSGALGLDRITRPRRSRPSALLRVFEFPSGGGGTHPLPTLPLKGRASSGGLRATGSESAEAIGEGLDRLRSEEHTSELQSLMRNSYAVFCLKKKNKYNSIMRIIHHNNRNTHRDHRVM